MIAEGLLSHIRQRCELGPEVLAALSTGPSGTASITFKGLWELAERYAPLMASSSKPGQVVPLFMSRSFECLALMVACVMTNRVFSVINNRVQVPQLEHVLAQSGTRTLWVDGPGISTLKKGLSNAERLHHTDIFAIRTEHWLPLHEKQVVTLGESLTLTVLLSDQPPGVPFAVTESRGLEGAAACLFTSGSTGTPKGVLISDGDLVSRGLVEADNFRLHPNDRILNILPWSFDVGLNQVLTCWMRGCTLVILNSWLPLDIVEAASSHGVVGLSAVPSVWIDMLAADVTFRHPKPRYVTISGGSLTAAHQAELLERLDGIDVIKTYGQTETFRSAIAFPRDTRTAPNSVGRQYDGTRVYVVDEKLRPLPVDSEGEILHSGNGVMLGYLAGGDSNKLIPNPFYGQDGDTSRNAIRTGDRGLISPDGRLYLLGREDDLVKIQGNRVYLSEIIAEAQTLPEILEAQPVLLCSGDACDLVLFATLHPSASETDGKAIRKRLSNLLPSYMTPKVVIVLEFFPRTASGKVDRLTLQRMLA